jgi:hypothetical protein
VFRLSFEERQVFSEAFLLQLLGRDEAQRGRVDAVTQAGGRGAARGER